MKISPFYDKSHKLHLENSTERISTVRNIYIRDPENPIDTYLLLKKCFTMIDKVQNRFYCYPATVKNWNLQKSYLGDVVIHSKPSCPI